MSAREDRVGAGVVMRAGSQRRASKQVTDQPVDRLLGELEASVMRLMWVGGAATVREVLDRMHSAGRPLAYTTVMTVMSRLATKGLLTRELVGKTHIYRAALSEEAFLRASATQRVQALVDEFGDLAIAQFLAEVSDLSPKRRRQLKRLASEDAG